MTVQGIKAGVTAAFLEEIAFETIYKDTVRKAGYTVPGDGAPRDTYDEGELLHSLDIIETATGIVLEFDDDAAPFTMVERPELTEEILDQIDIGEITVDILQNFLRGRF